MKTFIFSLILVVPLFCHAQTTASPTKADIAIYIGIDKTSSTDYSSSPSAKNILSPICTDESSSVTVLVSEINDVSLTAVSRFSLSGKKFLENPMTRQDSKDIFYSSVDQKVKEIFSRPNGKQESSIYLLLCGMVNDVCETGAHKKSLILFTDFMEHSSITMSFYSLYKQSPDFIKSFDTIVKQLESAEILNDMSGIDVTVVYEPSLETNGMFHQTRKFWTKYLRSKGANIHFVATL